MSLKRIFIALFTVSYLFLLTLLALAAIAIDRQFSGGIPIDGDDKQYQTLAVNLTYGQGYVDAYVLPLATYNLHTDVTDSLEMEQLALAGGMAAGATRDFYRAPGLPTMLAVTYLAFGNTALNAHLMMVTLTGATAFLLLSIGATWAGLRGIIIGGFVGLLYLIPGMIRSSPEQNVLTEIPSAFLVVLFTFWMVRYGRTPRTRTIIGISLTLAALILTRANLLTVFPLILIYFVILRIPRQHLLIFVFLVAVPIALWSLYASSHVGKFVSLTTQGESAFPQFNNIDVLYGSPVDRSTRGDWNPGYALDANGKKYTTWEHAPAEGENGWTKGFDFWRDHLTELPNLFAAKLAMGFWTRPPFVPIYWSGIAFILFLAIRGTRPIWLISSPVWYGAFVLSHLMTTLLFGGFRFHEPLDPVLTLIGGFGAIALVERVFARLQIRRNSSF